MEAVIFVYLASTQLVTLRHTEGMALTINYDNPLQHSLQLKKYCILRHQLYAACGCKTQNDFLHLLHLSMYVRGLIFATISLNLKNKIGGWRASQDCTHTNASTPPPVELAICLLIT